MQRYFITNEQWQNDEITITGNNYHHMYRVMRMTEGDEVICNDEQGHSARCKISKINENEIILSVLQNLDESSELPVHVTIAQGLPKRDKLEFVLQKGTELGANRFIPFKAARSVVKWNEKKAKSRMKRYEKIIKEAAEQSHRNRLPQIDLPQTINELIETSKNYDVKIVAYEEEAKTERTNSIKNAFKQLKKGDKLFVCIGPEGGFSKEEIEQLKENDFQTVRLGPRILRTETASLYVLASLSYCLEE